MRNVHQIIFVLLIAILFSGCTPANIQAISTPSPDNSSTITIFRPDVSFAMGNDMIVAIDDNEIAVLRNNQYVSALVSPGEHKVSVRGTAGSASEAVVKTGKSNTKYFEAAGSGNNSVNFIPGTVLFKANFYIEPSVKFDTFNYTEIFVNYK